MLGRKILAYSVCKWPDVYRAAPCQQGRDQRHLRHAGRFGGKDFYCSWLQGSGQLNSVGIGLQGAKWQRRTGTQPEVPVSDGRQFLHW
jgi:hypothetical protein